MKSYAKSLILAPLLLLACILEVGVVSAQTRLGDLTEVELRMSKQTESLIQKLGVTGETAEAVRALLEARNEELIEARGSIGKRSAPDFRKTMGAMRMKIGEIDSKTKKTLGELLTPEQMAQYEEYLKETRERRRPPRQ